ncbi:hypothetical protein BW731_07140 [Vagococcus martis]|uniref:Uncharacterized protein n=1 Tax=Vagococcus martis TaxID=1768210 RepID=A0A1V4DHR5_9ENTE|nr:LPXTG cell wall anchor domain-containing protein [Vagococcus martis]OPF87961.1 hypothetical protein BW731_07140 [Vagococcus martis]
MANQIDVIGIIGETNTSQSDKNDTNPTSTPSSTLQIYYQELPKTNDYMNSYYLGLGVTIILLIMVIKSLKTSYYK